LRGLWSFIDEARLADSGSIVQNKIHPPAEINFSPASATLFLVGVVHCYRLKGGPYLPLAFLSSAQYFFMRAPISALAAALILRL
jgi:hypothetical protein